LSTSTKTTVSASFSTVLSSSGKAQSLRRLFDVSLSVLAPSRRRPRRRKNLRSSCDFPPFSCFSRPFSAPLVSPTGRGRHKEFYYSPTSIQPSPCSLTKSSRRKRTAVFPLLRFRLFPSLPSLPAPLALQQAHQHDNAVSLPLLLHSPVPLVFPPVLIFGPTSPPHKLASPPPVDSRRLLSGRHGLFGPLGRSSEATADEREAGRTVEAIRSS
jgi:hypothetical protein